MRIELLSKDNFNKTSLDNYVRTHEVKRVYRKREGEYVLVDYSYTEEWDMEERREIAETISGDDYITYLAFEDKEVIAFLALKKELVEENMILDMMYVSGLCRGQGIGRKLFNLARKEAKKAGAKALYISACSSEETIAFYEAMGAKLTNQPIKEMAEKEPYDLQMTCLL